MGNVRNSNQDSFAVLRRGDLSNRLDALLVLADGMGGAGGGDVASRIVAEAVPESVGEFLYERGGGNGPDVEQMLRETFTRANHKVWTTRKFERPELKQMGTTCVTAVVNEGVLTVANLGDSRAYLLRMGKLSQLTEDHSEVWREVQAGRMTREEAQNSRFRNRITRAIGLGPEVKTDIFRVPLQEGDTVLLCSDGLTGEVRDADIARIMAAIPDIQEVCETLVDAALDHGGRDNVTVVALRYGNFVPFTLPVTTDEDDTDPEQRWKEQIYRPRPDELEDEEEDDDKLPTAPPPRRAEPRPTRVEEPAYTSSRRQTNPVNGMLVSLLILALAVAGVEAYLLYNGGIGKPTKNPTKETPLPPIKPEHDLHTYGAPKLMLKDKEVQDACLMIDDKGNPVVASRTGNLITVQPNGTPTLLGGTFPSLSPQANSDPNSKTYAPARPDFAFDPNRNLFFIDPETKSIQIYSKSGTRVGTGIGRGQLVSPVRIAVNADDVIFVIDNHKLYRITTDNATPTAGQ